MDSIIESHLTMLHDLVLYTEPNFRPVESPIESLRRGVLRAWMNDEAVEWLGKAFVANARIACDIRDRKAGERHRAFDDMCKMLKVLGLIVIPDSPGGTTNVQFNAGAVLERLRGIRDVPEIIDSNESSTGNGNGRLLGPPL
jgi:hypothetical protein